VLPGVETVTLQPVYRCRGLVLPLTPKAGHQDQFHQIVYLLLMFWGSTQDGVEVDFTFKVRFGFERDVDSIAADLSTAEVFLSLC
jgi:hypothetical protein